VTRLPKPPLINSGLTFAFCLCFCILLGLGLDNCAFAQSQIVKLVPTPHMQAMQMMRENKKKEALAFINDYLGQNPSDPQMLFWKAKLLRESPRPSDQDTGLQIYLSLSENNPELAEPHNNLGVIYAALGDYLKAISYFEAALRANPGLAIANENLADVYVQMAVKQYQNAIENDPKNKSAKIKLDQISPKSGSSISK